MSDKEVIQKHFGNLYRHRVVGTQSAKQERIMAGLWNWDQLNLATASVTGQTSPIATSQYLAPSAAELRTGMTTSPGWPKARRANAPRGVTRAAAHLDEHLTLLLDCKSARYILIQDVGDYHKLSASVAGTDKFLTSFFACMIHPNTKGALERVTNRMKLPERRVTQTLREVIIEHPCVVSTADRCKAKKDVTVLAADGQYSTLLKVVGQIAHGQDRNSEPLGPQELHAMLSVMCGDGFLHVEPFPSEKLVYLVAALRAGVGAHETGKTKLVLSDTPEITDDPELHREFGVLDCVGGDPLHVALRVEKAWGGHSSDFSRRLRRSLCKLQWGIEDHQPYYRKAAGQPPSHPTIAEVLRTKDIQF